MIEKVGLKLDQSLPISLSLRFTRNLTPACRRRGRPALRWNRLGETSLRPHVLACFVAVVFCFVVVSFLCGRLSFFHANVNRSFKGVHGCNGGDA